MLRTFTRFPGAGAPEAVDLPARPATVNPPYSSHSRSNDGVFANLDAKPERGEKLEEQPPVCYSSKYHPIYLTDFYSRTKLQQPMLHHRTGKPQSLRLAISPLPTKSTLTVFLSVPCSRLYGMA